MDRIEEFFKNMAILKEYLEIVMVKGQILSDWERADKNRRVRAYLKAGSSLDMTEKEMVSVLYKEVLHR